MGNLVDIKKQGERDHYAYFEEKGDKKWSKIFVDHNNLKNTILKLEYEQFHKVNLSFNKLDITLGICEFLRSGKRKEPYHDTDKMIVTFFVLCAEAVFRTINPYENSNEQLVKSFFETVYRKIQYTIRYNMGSKIEDQNSARLLYLIRNDYLHNGNSIGLFFKDDKEIENVYNVGSFEYRPVSNVRELTREIIECSLTYKDFRDIFLEAFISNICKYCKNQFEFLNRQEIDKKKAIMHLRYEKEVFDKCAELIMNEKDNKLKIIYTESFLLHARNLSYFLSKGKQYLTDINWSDFISKPIKIKFLEGQGLRQINKFLMHMTRERIDFKTPDGNWRAIEDIIDVGFDLFVKELDSEIEAIDKDSD